MIDPIIQQIYTAVRSNTAIDTSLADRMGAAVKKVKQVLEDAKADETAASCWPPRAAYVARHEARYIALGAEPEIAAQVAEDDAAFTYAAVPTPNTSLISALEPLVDDDGAPVRFHAHLVKLFKDFASELEVYVSWVAQEIEAGTLNTQESASGVEQHFSLVLGGAASLVANFESAANSLSKGSSPGGISSAAAAIASAMAAEDAKQNSTFGELVAMSDALSYAALIDDPVALTVIQQVAQGGLAAAIEARAAQQAEDFGWIVVPDSTPVSDDDTPVVDPDCCDGGCD